MFEIGTLLKIPRGTPGVAPLELEIGELLVVEKERKKDVITVTKETAPELMHVLNSAYCLALRMMATVKYEYDQAVKNSNKRRAIVILDVVPEVLKKKELISKRSPAGSEDLRQAVLDLDDEYSDLLDRIHFLKATHEYLKSKAKYFENSYYSVKKVYDNTNTSLGVQHLNGDISDDLMAGETEIGEPRYTY